MYIFGDEIELSVTFSEAVHVSGTPSIAIDMDPAHWGTKWASYDSGSGTKIIDFSWTIIEPNYSSRGIAVLANTLKLNGGSIRSVEADVDANLSHSSLGHDKKHKVNWKIQPVASVSSTSSTCSANTTVSAYGIEDGAVVQWTVSNISNGCSIEKFTVQASKSGLNSAVDILDPSVRSVIMTDLDAGDYTFSLYVHFEGFAVSSNGFVRKFAGPGQGSPGEPSTDEATIPEDCGVILTVAYATDATYQVDGSWTNASDVWGCEAGGVYVRWKKASESEWKSSFRVGNEDEDKSQFKFGGLDSGVSYEFKVMTIDARGMGVPKSQFLPEWMKTSDVATSTPRGGVTNIQLDSDGYLRESIVSWDAYTGFDTLTGYKVTWWRDHDRSNVKSTGMLSTTTIKHPLTNLPPYSRHNVVVSAFGTIGGKTVERQSAPAIMEIDDEPFMTWFIDDTPTMNFSTNRFFVKVDTNRGNAEGRCVLNGGTINCPPRTLVSFDDTERISGTTIPKYTLYAYGQVSANLGYLRTYADGSTTTKSLYAQTQIESTGVLEGGIVRYLSVSAGDNKLAIDWHRDSIGAPHNSWKLVSFVIEYQRRGEDSKFVHVGSSETSYTLRNLKNGEYKVTVHPCAAKKTNNTDTRCKYSNGDYISTTTGTIWGMKAYTKSVYLSAHKINKPTHVVNYSAYTGNNPGELIARWSPAKPGVEAAQNLYYNVRFTPLSGNGEPILLQIRDKLPWEIHNRWIHGVTVVPRGVAYKVEVSAVNVNGRGPWTTVASSLTPN